MHFSCYVLPGLAALTLTLASPQGGGHHHSRPGAGTALPAITATTAAAIIGTPTPVATNSKPAPSLAVVGSSPSGTSSAGSTPSGSGTTVCDATSTLTADGYTIMANIWGATLGLGGSQCAQAAGTSGSGVAWTTTWNWNSGDNVKSFANANGDTLTPCKAVNDITSIPSTWKWR